MDKPLICFVTGAAGSGKTTTSLLLAKMFKKCVVIEVDDIRAMIKNGHISPFEEGGYDELALSTKNTALVAKNFIKCGFTVIIDDFVSDSNRLAIYKRAFTNFTYQVIVLLPHLKASVTRDAKRTGSAHMGPKKVEYLFNKISRRAAEEKDWHVIDNTKLSAQQTANRIYTILNR